MKLGDSSQPLKREEQYRVFVRAYTAPDVSAITSLFPRLLAPLRQPHGRFNNILCYYVIRMFGLEACTLNKSQLSSLDFTINRFFYETVSDQ